MIGGDPGAQIVSAHSAPSVGLFGGLGSGNIGNDASMEAMLSYLRANHPDVVVDAMCSGPEVVTSRYGITAISSQGSRSGDKPSARVLRVAQKVVGKGIDTVRIAAWVRRHDVVIVPGMGILETSLRLRAWQFPYTVFVLCAAGKVFRTKVALVSVGANVINQRLTRWLFVAAARLAFYRSYRDELSLTAMRDNGLAAAHDSVYCDLAFALPVPETGPADDNVVAIGVMEFSGSSDDDGRLADEIRQAYVSKIKEFARWLVDNGRTIRLFVGDTNGSDDLIAQEILADLRAARPGLDPTRAAAENVATFTELMCAMAAAGSAVVTRYHNLICALKLEKPTISIGYAEKNAAMMADVGLPEFSQLIGELDIERLIRQFTALENRSGAARQAISRRLAEYQSLVDRQFKDLSSAVLSSQLAPATTGHAAVH